MARRALCVVYLATAFFAAPTSAQQLGGSGLRNLSPLAVDSLRAELDRGDWAAALKRFFGPILYDPTILDLAIYIPSTRESAQQLLLGDEATDKVEGHDAIYVLILSDVAPPQPDSTHFTVSVRTLQHSDDPALTALLKSLVGAFKGSAVAPEVAAPPDSSITLRLEIAGRGSAGPLYAAMGRLKLGVDSRTRLTVIPLHDFVLPVDRSVHYQFQNASGSRYGVSLAGGTTLGAGRPILKDATRVGTEGDVRTALYLFGHFYLNKPHLPGDSFSIGLAAGTNIVQGSLLDDLVFGLSLGRWNGLGLLGGINLMEWSTLKGDPAQVDHYRKSRAFIGLDFRL